MSEIRLSKALKELNITLKTASDFLESSGLLSDSLNRNSKISQAIYNTLKDNFAGSLPPPSKQKAQKEPAVVEKTDSNTVENTTSKDQDEVQDKSVIKAQSRVVKVSKVAGKIDLSLASPKPSIAPPSSTVQENLDEEEVDHRDNSKVKRSKCDTEEKKKQEDQGDSNPSKIISAKAKIDFRPMPVRKLDLSPSAAKKKEYSPSTITSPQQPPLEETNVTSDSSKKVTTSRFQKIKGVSSTGKMVDLSQFDTKKVEKSDPKSPPSRNNEAKPSLPVNSDVTYKKRKRIRIDKESGFSTKSDKRDQSFERPSKSAGSRGSRKKTRESTSTNKEVLSDRQIVATASRYRKLKRKEQREKEEIRKDLEDAEGKVIRVTEFITLSELATLMDISISGVMETCMSLGLAPSINQSLDKDTLSLVVEEYGFTLDIISPEAALLDIEDEDDEADLVYRSPVVTVMGHVDHGKTSLLDYLRKSKVVSGESGGITQHIGAYAVDMPDGKKITFLDTPGHEAFTEMRSRGVKMTDVAIVVVSAEDGVKPRTEESIAHAQAANVPIVFAINKIDKPNANPQLVRQHLAERNILVDDFGGKYASQDISAKTGQGVQELLEKVLLEAEVMELKGNPKAKYSSGVVIDSFMQKGRGYMSTFLIQRGTLKKGDIVVAGKSYGKIKSMISDSGQLIKEAPLSFPITVIGLDGSPSSGDRFRVCGSEKEAKSVAANYRRYSSEQSAKIKARLFRSEMDKVLDEGLSDVKNLNVIIRADVDGSLSTISEVLGGLSSEKIKINILFGGVGQITESDISFAIASQAIVIGFGIKPISSAKKLADSKKIPIHLYTVIYRLSEDIQKIVDGMVDVETVDEFLGSAEVRNVYRKGTIAGCVVLDGKMIHKNKVKVIRDGDVVYDDVMKSLKRFETDVPEVEEGLECGIGLKESFKIKVGDMIECYK